MEKTLPNLHQTTQNRRATIRKLLRIRYLLKWLPRRTSLKRFPVLGNFANYLRKQKFLWSFNESSVAPAIVIGSIVAFLPLFGIQLLTVMAIALVLKMNLPVLAGLQFISNPFTLVPIYMANYKVGSWLLHATGLASIQDTANNSFILDIHSTLIGGTVLGTLVGLFLYGLYWIHLKRTLPTSEVAL